MKENKCEELKIEHSWEDITAYGFCYLTDPPQSPPKKERCRNCDLVRIHRKQTKEWFEYLD